MCKPKSSMVWRNAVVPAWSAVVTSRPPSTAPDKPQSRMGCPGNSLATLITAWLGIQPARQVTNKSKSAPASSATARRTSLPSGSSLTGAVLKTSRPEDSSHPVACWHFLSMISRGVFTSPKPTKPTLGFNIRVSLSKVFPSAGWLRTEVFGYRTLLNLPQVPDRGFLFRAPIAHPRVALAFRSSPRRIAKSKVGRFGPAWPSQPARLELDHLGPTVRLQGGGQ